MLLRVAVALICIGAITAFDFRFGNLLAKRKANYVCYQHPLDIVFILDASSSIWSQNFTKAKAFVNSFISPYEIGPQKVRVAIETYADVVYTQDVIHFNDFLTNESLQKQIAGLKWHHGSRTETGLGIAYMTDTIMKEARPGLPKICIVITDGKSQDSAKTALEAKKARLDRIEMFAIGVSRAVNESELQSIAGDPDRVIIVETYSELEAIKDKLSGKTCKEIPTTTTTTPAPTPAAEECGTDNPTDIYYVFDPAYLGMERVNWVTQFITHTLSAQEFAHMRVGVISGSCPLDAGFNLKEYSTIVDVRERLESYDSPRFTKLIGSLSSAYSSQKGGRGDARKVAVIFIGGKIDQVAVIKNAQAAKEAGIDVYFADAGNADPGFLDALNEIGFSLARAGAGSIRQAHAFVEELCREY
ncbi:collagen alpha-6(VI) chain-like [Patella vulgata]|uniref:collagen alpha-6(VI) chain-like n=1 Tax=Patella vulgata TaxID=6465 RepID=UPI0024A9610D|nr:collagen alpha-6(VI) chain-like [Patella vulgata]